MGKLKLNPKGFTAVEGLLIILVLAVVGFGGYYVWHTQHQNSTKASTTNTRGTGKSSTQTATTSPDPTAEWLSYTSANGFSVMYPSQWSKNEENTTEGPSNTVTGNIVSFKSPDYQLTNGRFPTAMAGGEFLIMQTPTNYSSISDYTSNDSTDAGITYPEGGAPTTIDGIAAIHGTCSDAGGSNICISLVKSGQLYELRYYYANSETPTTAKYLNGFNSFLGSFKFL